MTTNNIIKFLDEVPIADMVSKFITLKKISGLYWGLCPFHQENTPSMVVNTDKKFFYCFGCGVGGNAINFLMKHQEISFGEAVTEITQWYNITTNIHIHSKTYDNIQYENQIIDFFTTYSNICHQKLMINSKALDYLNQRGVSLNTIRQYNIGYDDGEINDLITMGYTMSQFQEYGILNNESWHSKFKDRIIFPVTNINNAIISIVGRTVMTEAGVPKYLHAIENPIFYKKTSLFNYHNIKNFNEIYIVEGFFDMLSCINNNIPNVVACLGSSISSEQAFILQKNHKIINLLLDGDTAGVQGMIKGGYKFLPYYGIIKINFFILQGMDPAEFFIYNNLNDIKSLPLEEFFWQYEIKKDYGLDGASLVAIENNIENILIIMKKLKDISNFTIDILGQYWQQQLKLLKKSFIYNGNKKFEPLPIVANKTKILIIVLFYKANEIINNIDQLSSFNIKDYKLLNIFNKIINIVVEYDITQNNIQDNIVKNLNEEEKSIIFNNPLHEILKHDERSLQCILNEEFCS